MRKSWWKLLSFALLMYTCWAGLLNGVPELAIVNESIRNLYFHVPMWMSMMVFFIISIINAIRYLHNPLNIKFDTLSAEYAKTGLLFGILGTITGAIWATYTWGTPWSNDPKQIGTAIGLLIYCAYLVLRNAIEDPDKKARISAVYNIFAFALLIPSLYVVPRMVESLHPGGAGDGGFNTSDLDARMRSIFWLAAVPGWTLLGVWITTLKIRWKNLEEKITSNA